MPDLIYSSEALSTLTEFHQKKYVIFVEGDEDVVFWEVILNHFGINDYYLKSSGGIEELKKYMESILKDNTNIYAFADNDYSDILHTQNRHPNIIYTYGYSIENSLYSSKNIEKIINIYSRQTNSHTKDFEKWLDDFCISLYDLIVLDICNEAFSRGLSVLGDNSCRVLKNNDSYNVCVERVKGIAKSLKSHFNSEELNKIKTSIQKTNKSLPFIIRGHFLTNALMNYIKKRVKNVSKRKVGFSKDNLYNQLIAQFPNTILTSIDIEYLMKRIKTIMN